VVPSTLTLAPRGGSDQLLADLRPSSHSLPPGATSHIADLHPPCDQVGCPGHGDPRPPAGSCALPSGACERLPVQPPRDQPRHRHVGAGAGRAAGVRRRGVPPEGSHPHRGRRLRLSQGSLIQRRPLLPLLLRLCLASRSAGAAHRDQSGADELWHRERQPNHRHVLVLRPRLGGEALLCRPGGRHGLHRPRARRRREQLRRLRAAAHRAAKRRSRRPGARQPVLHVKHRAAPRAAAALQPVRAQRGRPDGVHVLGVPLGLGAAPRLRAPLPPPGDQHRTPPDRAHPGDQGLWAGQGRARLLQLPLRVSRDRPGRDGELQRVPERHQRHLRADVQGLLDQPGGGRHGH